MPSRFNTVCSYPGCPRLTKNGRCIHHPYTTERKSSVERGYDTQWTKVRNAYIRDHPVCEILQTCNGDPAVEVDHITPIEHGGIVHDEDNLQSTCKACHTWKTRTIDYPDGFGARI